MKNSILKLTVLFVFWSLFLNCVQTSNKASVKNDTLKSEHKKVTSSNMENKKILDRNIHIGMSIEDFKKECPDIITGEYKTTQVFSKKEEIEGLKGEWGFDFKDSKLVWYNWDIYINDFNQENFDKSLKAIQEIISICTQKYGKPTKLNKGDFEYKDPFKKRHWGYDVLDAFWQTKNESFIAKFKFSGGKGEYYFLLKIDFHEVGYEYF